jgi:competence protein ComER
MTRYGFIGTGSMGSMLIRHFIRTGVATPQEITACSRTGISAHALATETGIAVVESNRDVAHNADVLFICVRPLDVCGVLGEIRDVLSKDTLLVSVVGCVTLADITTWTGPAIRCVKIIPSVTAEEHSGISLVAWGSWITPADKELVFTLFSAIGTPVEIDENHIEVYSDLTSCAPALFAAMMQEFAAAAVRKEGVPAGSR